MKALLVSLRLGCFALCDVSSPLVRVHLFKALKFLLKSLKPVRGSLIKVLDDSLKCHSL